ncbi:conserved protein of unknown function [Rhodovastum atsumiense]|uniref:Autotransporter outer membrane beta-barrel domain-containing protein n=1 Tax=Rhodovastum atsumiense TaxID=504468 RepID=A0A5M6J229_9PROT|nr:hypothetical protein [Rhodovastum atsumiense]KAA5614663.1 hypothetical protein F1189_00615 [Rhodovastum atsumiense]CAH2599807.1 conserved protein of unknown function [Rhodovastum atsumiense]
MPVQPRTGGQTALTTAMAHTTAQTRPDGTLVVSSGTVTFRNTTLSGTTVQLVGTETAPPTLAISGVTLARNTSVGATNYSYVPTQYVFAGTLRASGQNTNLGTIRADSTDFQRAGQLRIDIAAAGGQFTNRGTITSGRMGDITVHAAATGARLANNGVIDVGGHATIDASVIGTGTIRFQQATPLHGFVATPNLTTTGAVGSGQTIRFLGGDDLRIGNLRDFHGLISGFSATSVFHAQDHIDLLGHNITAARFANGVLTLTENGATAGRLRFAGSYAADAFQLTHSQLSTGTSLVDATTITLRA